MKYIISGLLTLITIFFLSHCSPPKATAENIAGTWGIESEKEYYKISKQGRILNCYPSGQNMALSEGPILKDNNAVDPDNPATVYYKFQFKGKNLLIDGKKFVKVNDWPKDCAFLAEP